MSKTALQLHIDMMKAELQIMESTNIKFGLLINLIKEANSLLKLEQLDLMDAYHAGRMQQYTDQKQSSLEYFTSKFNNNENSNATNA